MNNLWPGSPDEAFEIQNRLRRQVETQDRFGPVNTVAGIDGHYGAGDMTWAAIMVLGYPDLKPRGTLMASLPNPFPYVPGLLSFREAPVMLDALARLKTPPDLLMVDGQGIAHPRRLGLASHVGVLADLPAIGVAKSRLCGRHEEPEDRVGAWTPLVHRGETVGAVLRTRQGVRPLFISPGHRIGLATSIDFVLRCVTRYRLPEPTRLADRLSRQHPP